MLNLYSSWGNCPTSRKPSNYVSNKPVKNTTVRQQGKRLGMPSLTVVNTNIASVSWKDTYRNYLGSVNEKDQVLDASLHLIPYLKWFIHFILLNLIYFIWFLGLQVFTFHYRSVYDKYHFYYLHDTFFIIVQILFASIFCINFCSKKLSNHKNYSYHY